jgi:hypothetical protein|tara:strand:- start:215 stop:700 length:486 start_codon:yes stop_codon:yes gene_type:complete
MTKLVNSNELLNVIKEQVTTDANLKNQDRKAYIYLMKGGYSTYKIGFSVNPEQRVRTSNTYSYHDNILLDKIDVSGLVQHLENKTINVMGVIYKKRNREWVKIPAIDSKIVKAQFRFIVKNMVNQIRKNVRDHVKMENKVLEKYNIKPKVVNVQTTVALSK